MTSFLGSVSAMFGKNGAVSARYSSAASGYWPHDPMINVMRQMYDSVEHDGDEDNKRYYKVELNGFKFLAVLLHAEGHPDKITAFAFLCSFAGFEITQTGLDALNRVMNLSVAELGEAGNLILFAALEAKGPFDPNRFSLILQAWHRDVVMTVKMIFPEASVASALPARALALAEQYAITKPGSTHSFEKGPSAATNGSVLPDEQVVSGQPLDASLQTATAQGRGLQPDYFGGEGSSRLSTATHAGQNSPNPSPAMHSEEAMARQSTGESMIAALLGTRDASRTVCSVCEGRGRTGFPRRTCDPCKGSGLTAPV